MTAPNEPGALSKGDGPNADGLVDRGAHIGQRPGQAAYQMLETRRRGSVLRLGNPKRGIVSRRRYHTLRAPDQPARRRRCSAESLHLRCVCPGDRPSRRGQDPAAGSRRFAGVWRRFPAEAYASELPDLSGPTPRAPQRNPRRRVPRRVARDREDSAAGSSGGRSITAESRDACVQLSARRSRGPVRASMQIRRIDPWSTLKVSLLLSVALFFVWMITVAFLYLVLGGMGVWAKLNSNVGDLLNNASGSSAELVSSGTIFGGAFLIGLVNIVLMTALATIGAFVYNLITDLIGGIEVTLADRD